MSEILRKYVAQLSEEQLREEHLSLLVKYEERGMAMRETSAMVRSLYVCTDCGKRILIIGEGHCHCPNKVRAR